MAAYDVSRAVKKQIDNVQSNVDSYIAGVRANTKHPGEEAIKKKQKMRNNFLAALDGTKFDEGARSYTLQDYVERTATVGARNLPQGIKDAEPKLNEFHSQFSTFLDGHLAKVNGMKDDTVEERLQKMRENALGIMKFKRQRRR